MPRYRNLGGDSGVKAYEIGEDFIEVEFSGRWIYIYSNRITGTSNVESMKALATAGRGLHSFINRRIKHKYESKYRGTLL